ncbi:MAG TPA: DUF2336 domain-containing protein, partial [Roseiarcus sp.]|nr:DUF2336 domain-containing protein [Roseiarcus sp.]
MRDLTLSDFPFLASLAKSHKPEDRRIWLRVACDHFVAAGPAGQEDIERFADAVSSQIDMADLKTALEAARTLAPSPRTPARLLAKFASLSPQASDIVLEHGAACPTADLIAAIERGGHAAIAVARRVNLDARLIDALLARDEPAALAALAGNSRTRLEGAVLMRLLRRARTLAERSGDRRLADALLKRRPLRVESAMLFLLADPAERVEILLAAQRAELGRPPCERTPASAEIVRELELAALARRPERFVA